MTTVLVSHDVQGYSTGPALLLTKLNMGHSMRDRSLALTMIHLTMAMILAH